MRTTSSDFPSIPEKTFFVGIFLAHMGNSAARDTQEYRDRYPGKEDDLYITSNVKFYKNEKTISITSTKSGLETTTFLKAITVTSNGSSQSENTVKKNFLLAFFTTLSKE